MTASDCTAHCSPPLHPPVLFKMSAMPITGWSPAFISLAPTPGREGKGGWAAQGRTVRFVPTTTHRLLRMTYACNHGA